MLENDRMETASEAVTSIRKTTWRNHQCFVDFESRIHVEISTSNWCHIFHVDSPFEIDEISTNFPRGILTSNRWRIDEDVSIWMIKHFRNDCVGSLFSIIESNGYVNDTVCPIALEKGLEREEHWMKTLRTK